jgi:hypothetical protein
METVSIKRTHLAWSLRLAALQYEDIAAGGKNEALARVMRERAREAEAFADAVSEGALIFVVG